MSIRTPNTLNHRQALLDLQQTKARLAENQQRITTGKRITRPAEDPSATALIMDFGNAIQSNQQFQRSVDSALGLLLSAEDAVSAAINSNMRLQELAALAQGHTAAGQAAMVPELDGLRDTLLSLANTQAQGKYLFAGTLTQTQPFTDTAPPLGPVTYAGNGGSISLDVNVGIAVATNVPGDAAFFGAGGQGSATDIFQAMTDLRNGLTTSNSALIQTAATNLQGILESLNQAQAVLGGRQRGLLDLKDTLSGMNVTLEGLQNAKSETDYPKAAVEFSNDQTIQSASLSVMAKINQSNLFDFLG